jgi:hypothetical protein
MRMIVQSRWLLAEHVEAIPHSGEILPIVLATIDDVWNSRPSCFTEVIPRNLDLPMFA